MKVQQINAFGDADVFQAADIDMPQPGPRQLRIRQIAASVNPVDTKIRQLGPAFAPELPAVLGCDVAGVVDAVGAGVSGFEKGDAVYGCAAGVAGHGGGYGEYVVVDAAFMARAPKGLDWRQTAALPLVVITAWEALIDRARIAPGMHVLIHGGTGGVGHIAVQLAKAFGARVATTVSTKAKAELARSLGADEIIFYNDEAVADYVQRLTDAHGFDVVFDASGGDDIAKSFEAARVNGQVVTIVSRYEADLSIMHSKSLSLHVVLMLTALINGTAPAHHAEILTKTNQLIAAGQLRPLLDDKRFRLADVADAHRHLESGQAVGKIVLDIAEEATRL